MLLLATMGLAGCDDSGQRPGVSIEMQRVDFPYSQGQRVDFACSDGERVSLEVSQMRLSGSYGFSTKSQTCHQSMYVGMSGKEGTDSLKISFTASRGIPKPDAADCPPESQHYYMRGCQIITISSISFPPRAICAI